MDDRLALFERELSRWNRKMNLLGPMARTQLQAHIDEARQAGTLLEPEGVVCDLGSGNGIPAVPIAIDHPEIVMLMVEADQRKWAFLKHVSRVCRLRSEVHGDRFERLLETGRLDDTISLLISRAVADPEQWLPLSKRALKENGRVGLFRTGPDLPPIDGFERVATHKLDRGSDNYLIELRKL